MPCVKLRVSTFLSFFRSDSTVKRPHPICQVNVCVQHQTAMWNIFALPFGKQRRVKWCLFCTLLTISGVLWCLLSVRLYKAIVSVHMFVCEIPDKALIIREEQGHNGELLISIYIFLFLGKVMNTLSWTTESVTYRLRGLWQRQSLENMFWTGLYCNFILHTHKQLKWNLEPKSWFRFLIGTVFNLKIDFFLIVSSAKFFLSAFVFW